MRIATKLSIIFLLFAFTLSTITIAQAQTSAVNDAQNAINNAYTAIQQAYTNGADITQLTEQLNQAINLTAQAQQIATTNPQQAETLANQAKTAAQNITEQATVVGQSAASALPMVPLAAAAALVIAGVGVFLLGPKAMWKIWFKLRKNNRVNMGNSNGKAVFLTAEQLCAIILAIAVVVALISVSGFLLPKNQGEQFSELGILGPNMQLSDYPSQIVAGDTIHLYGYVGNQMGTPMYYSVMVKLGNNATQVNPSLLAPIEQYSQVIPNNQSWTFPIDLTLTNPGVNQRVIFELWIYNQTTNQNQYHERWGQIWLNVTAPIR
jgi:hypothetical protein